MLDKNTLFYNLVNRYNTIAYTHRYIFGFIYKGLVYMAFANGSELPYLTTLSKASRGQGYSVRFLPTKEQKKHLLKNAKVICSADYFETLCESNTYNKGENFEALVSNRYGIEWKKDTVPFTEDGDITINKKAYQIKFEKATFCNEKSLANLEK